MSIDPDSLERRLHERFGGTTAESRVVARQAVDLDDSGRYEATTGLELTTDLLLSELSDAPDGTPAERWNWWIGSLEIAFGAHEEFSIRRYRR